jgi:hypothetical protein
MFFLLVLITTIFIKNNFYKDSESFNYLLAFTLPFCVLVLFFGIFVYARYLSKLKDSHWSTFVKLTVLLTIFCLSTVTFAILFGLYCN